LILYLDTSSLVKLYIAEHHSSKVHSWVEKAEIISTCRVAYPEVLSALTRRCRSGDLEKKDYELLVKTFSREWQNFAVIDFDELDAGRLVTVYGLRGFDAVHLSAAKLLRSVASSLSVAFSSFDDKLNDAAVAEKLTVLQPK